MGIMFVADMLDTKVRNADEVGKVVNAPLLGTLPQLPEEKTSIESEDWMMSESMQLIRENLNYDQAKGHCRDHGVIDDTE